MLVHKLKGKAIPFRPGQALKAPKVDAGRITGRSTHEGYKFVIRTHRSPLPSTIYRLVLMSLPVCIAVSQSTAPQLLLTQIKLGRFHPFHRPRKPLGRVEV
jgi:hypothetical protein